MKLTAKNVDALMKHCLFEKGEDISRAVKADMIVSSYSFHPERLESRRGEIGEMLSQLSKDFFEQGEGAGKGMSFLRSCFDANDHQWADLHLTMEGLFALGVATGQAKFCFPRSMWSVLPGGMPYLSVNPCKIYDPSSEPEPEPEQASEPVVEIELEAGTAKEGE